MCLVAPGGAKPRIEKVYPNEEKTLNSLLRNDNATEEGLREISRTSLFAKGRLLYNKKKVDLHDLWPTLGVSIG